MIVKHYQTQWYKKLSCRSNYHESFLGTLKYFSSQNKFGIIWNVSVNVFWAKQKRSYSLTKSEQVL